MIKIVHIIDKLSGGGPARSLITLAKVQQQLDLPVKHTAAALNKEAYPFARIYAKRAGIDVILGPDQKALSELISRADIVQLHFWNSPAVYEFLRGDWPARRMIVWLKVSGQYPPQVVTRSLLTFADCCTATTRLTLTLPAMQEGQKEGCIEFIQSLEDFDRLSGFEARDHDTFNVGYMGTVNFGKMHPDFAAMSAAVEIANSRFIICGGTDEALQQQIDELGAGDRFLFRGFVEDIKAELEIMDVFGYPLGPDTYATGEKSLQEALYVGIPPVVFPYGGVKHLVKDGKTGLVVNSSEEYTAAIERLYHDPDLRKALGANAKAYAREHFAPENGALQFSEQYHNLMKRPKVKRSWIGATNHDPAAVRFVESLGTRAPQFERSLKGCDKQAESEIAHSSLQLSGGEGGLFQYRNFYPEDPDLRFWAGLVLLQQGRYQESTADLQAALDMGVDGDRVLPYLKKAQGPAGK